ncbi:hypothetical protein ACIHFE_20625 [Streptomyces sp. NPDC052396]|uniref:hypothetical protein n=1 Tax=Streptomyces sp. NPDC052396 TaxID=3365689 RepID=UPI0037D9810B
MPEGKLVAQPVGTSGTEPGGKPALRPVRWWPPRRPPRSRAPYSRTPLPPVRRLAPAARGPEDVRVDATGLVLTGVQDGPVLGLDPADGRVRMVADTGGRPLGLCPLPDAAAGVRYGARPAAGGPGLGTDRDGAARRGPGRGDPLLDLLHRTGGGLRRTLWRLPSALLPGPRPTAWVIALDAPGRVVHDLQRPGTGFRTVTGVCEHDGRLFLGSPVESAVGVVPLAPSR